MDGGEEFDGALLEYLSCMDFFSLMKMVIHVVNLPKDSAGRDTYDRQKIQILSRVSSLLLCLLSTPLGLTLVRQNGKTLMELAKMQQSEDDGQVQEACRSFQEKLGLIRAVLESFQYFNTLTVASATSSECLSAIHTLSHVNPLLQRNSVQPFCRMFKMYDIKMQFCVCCC